MRDIPMKVLAVISVETGLFVGMGVILFYTLRTCYTATVNKAWHGFRSL